MKIKFLPLVASGRNCCLALICALLLAVGVSGCRSQPLPDLGGLYNRVAKHHDALRNPVIVIPGILGSKLIHPQTGQVVWGAFGGGAANPSKPQGARMVGLPMALNQPLSALRDEVQPAGVLDRLKVRLMGLPLQLQAYLRILMTLGAGGYRDPAIEYEVDYGDDHFTCFQFAYDWRRDNIENAHLLHQFVTEKRRSVQQEIERRYGKKDADIRFDIIAHSMGGLVLRYMLRYGSQDLPADGSEPQLTWEGAKHVDNAVIVATPSAGAVDSLVQLFEGRKFGPMTPLYAPVVIGTFPSIYQLLPRSRHGVMRDAEGQEIDFLDPEVWLRHEWGMLDPRQDELLASLLPQAASRSQRRAVAEDHVRKSLQRARRFHAALDQPAKPPEQLSFNLFAGDAVATASAAHWDAKKRRLKIVGHAPGDGSVLRSSALMDERLAGDWQPRIKTPISWSKVSFHFTDHLGITRDPAFTDNVLFLLLEAPR